MVETVQKRRQRVHQLRSKPPLELTQGEQAEIDTWLLPRDKVLSLVLGERQTNVSGLLEDAIESHWSLEDNPTPSASSIEWREWFSPPTEDSAWMVAQNIEALLSEASLTPTADFEQELSWAREYWVSDDLNLLDFLVRVAPENIRQNLIELRVRINSVFDRFERITPKLTRGPTEVWSNHQPRRYRAKRVVQFTASLERGPCVGCRHSNQGTDDADLGLVCCKFGYGGRADKQCDAALVDHRAGPTEYYAYEPYNGTNCTWFLSNPFSIEAEDGTPLKFPSTVSHDLQ